MITDTCNCGRSGHGCKALTRTTQSSWCPICDRNKMKRRCQSGGLHQESDPLKELNRCCDRGCDLINRSSKYSQVKKTELEMNEKKINYSDDGDVEGGDNYYNLGTKHRSMFHKEKIDGELGSQFQNSGCEINSTLELAKSPRLHKYLDPGLEKFKPCVSPQENSKMSKYHPMGDYHDVLPNSKTAGFSEKSSNEMRDRYIKEMEILRSKLCLLKDGISSDGKRMRHRSESEPGFTELPGGDPKRARDISPKVKMGFRKLPITPNLNEPLQQLSIQQSTSFRRDSKSCSPSFFNSPEKASKLSKHIFLTRKDIKNFRVNESDEEQEDKSSEESKDESEAEISCDDDASVGSNNSENSSDSNMPLKVQQSMGSISLNEIHNDANPLKCSNGGHNIVPKLEQATPNTMLNRESILRISLFPNVPPYIKIFMHDLKGPALPVDISRLLKWKLSSITPIVIRRTLLNSGFKLVRSELIQESNDWTGQWGKHMKSFVFKTLKDFQKLNHFPGTFQIGRKDRLWKNLYRLMLKFGKKEFGFIPKTYILPHDRTLLRTAWEKASGPGKGQWIVKPPAAARGTGIKVVHRWGQIPKKKALIVQKYIAQPYLINGSKFDLRLYVLMTSIHPLRIYLYDDGLVRFASVKYSEDVECLSNRFMHLTNYSINKLSNQYQVNADATSCHGHKWSLKSLWTYFAKEGVNVKALKKSLTDLVIKTIISGESNINMLSKNNLPSRYCSYELFGIDVLLDHTLKPWLLEVNISPSLHSASPLDLAVKGPLVKELLNIAGFQIPAKLTKEQEEAFLETYGLKNITHTFCYDKRLYWMTLSKEEKAKQDSFLTTCRKEYLKTILDDLTPDDVRHLIQFEDELTQLQRFEKIFPTSNTHIYHQFFESPRYYNMMLDAWETKYNKKRAEGIKLLSSLCEEKIHLNVPFPGGKTKSFLSLSDVSTLALLEDVPECEEVKARIEELNCKETASMSSSTFPRIPSPTNKNSVYKSAPLQPIVPCKSSIVASSSRSRPTMDRKLKVMTISPQRIPSTDHLQTSGTKAEEEFALKETSINIIAEMRSNGLKFTPDSKQDILKSFPSCKLENSLLGDSLNNGKAVLSPTKHIHNNCIKMNSTS